jgi:hypothetical protein
VRPHRFQDLFYDAVFNFFQLAELLPLFSPFVAMPAALAARVAPNLCPRGCYCRLEPLSAMPAGCPAQPFVTVPLATAKEAPVATP